MIYTITLNPSIDYYLEVSQPLIETEVNRCKDEKFKAGGKGLNVSFTLSKLNIPSVAIALLGGFTGNFIREEVYKDSLIKLIDIPVSGVNRINVKIHHDEEVLSVNGNGAIATKETKHHVLEALKDINENDWVIISGSMMSGLEQEFIIQISQKVNRSRAKLVIDMESLTIELLKQCKPYLIKPNYYEFKLLLEQPELSIEDLPRKVHEILDYGVESVLVSLGADGAYLGSKACDFILRQHEVAAVNKVGSGDAMLAAYIGSCTQDKSFQESLLWGGAAGIATVQTLETITLDEIKASLNDVRVEAIKD